MPVGSWAQRAEQCRVLGGPEESDVLVVSAKVDASVLPHSQGEDHIPDEDERLDTKLWQDSDNDRGESDNYERAGAKNESRIGGGVAVEDLQHLWNQDS